MKEKNVKNFLESLLSKDITVYSNENENEFYFYSEELSSRISLIGVGDNGVKIELKYEKDTYSYICNFIDIKEVVDKIINLHQEKRFASNPYLKGKENINRIQMDILKLLEVSVVDTSKENKDIETEQYTLRLNQSLIDFQYKNNKTCLSYLTIGCIAKVDENTTYLEFIIPNYEIHKYNYLKENLNYKELSYDFKTWVDKLANIENKEFSSRFQKWNLANFVLDEVSIPQKMKRKI